MFELDSWAIWFQSDKSVLCFHDEFLTWNCRPARKLHHFKKNTNTEVFLAHDSASPSGTPPDASFQHRPHNLKLLQIWLNVGCSKTSKWLVFSIHPKMTRTMNSANSKNFGTVKEYSSIPSHQHSAYNTCRSKWHSLTLAFRSIPTRPKT